MDGSGGMSEMRTVEIVDADGVISEVGEGADSLAMLVLRRHDAREQERAWEMKRKQYDALILRGQVEKVAVYSDVRATVKARRLTSTDVPAFLAAVAGMELTRDELYALLSAAKAFDAAMLPEFARPAHAAATTYGMSSPWVTTEPVLKRLEAE
jgi:hypothetical protein